MFDWLTSNWTHRNKLYLARVGVFFLCVLSYGLAEIICLIRENCFGKHKVSSQLSRTLVILEWCWLGFSGPLFGVYLLTLFAWPPWLRKELPARPWLNQSDSEHGEAPWKLHFRIVTRGSNPNLVATNCYDLEQVCKSICLLPMHYVIEVVTDVQVGFQQMSGVVLDEVVVPSEYCCKKESKWKSRALNFALERVSASADDWIVHMDEETKLDERCVTAIWMHVLEEQEAVSQGKRWYPDMGQGAMLYGGAKHGKIENWITTLGDSLRVCDDFGSFRAAFEWRNKFTFGMKGSFVVASQQVEELVTWDHGPSLSLTEDASFNMVALKEHKIGTAWIDAFMYEQSPFSMRDFAKQRQRWYVGLWMCIMSEKTRSPHMWLMPIKMLFWTSQIVVIFLHLAVLVTDAMPIHLEMCIFIYVCGFSITFTPQDGVLRWIGIACLQILLIPFFIYMEFMGVLGGVKEIVTMNAGTNFHIVKKENEHNVALPKSDKENQPPIDVNVAPKLDAKANSKKPFTTSNQPLIADIATPTNSFEPIPVQRAAPFKHVLGGVREIITRHATPSFHFAKKEHVHKVAPLHQQPVDAKTVPLLAADAVSERPAIVDMNSATSSAINYQIVTTPLGTKKLPMHAAGTTFSNQVSRPDTGAASSHQLSADKNAGTDHTAKTEKAPFFEVAWPLMAYSSQDQ